MNYRMLRGREVDARLGRSRSTRYLDIQDGGLTPPVPIGARAVGWPAHEIDAINAAKIAGWQEPEIRELVTQLMTERSKNAPHISVGPHAS